jgi:carbon storage regulator
MLVLSRKKGETIIIGDNIEISVVDIIGDQVRIGISAPREVSIVRKELYEEIKAENLKALQQVGNIKEGLEKLKKLQRKNE